MALPSISAIGSSIKSSVLEFFSDDVFVEDMPNFVGAMAKAAVAIPINVYVVNSTALLMANQDDRAREIFNTLTQPSISGIPIQTSRLNCRRTVEVAENPIIRNADGGKGIITDNVNPHPRNWSLEGYLRSAFSELEQGLLLKPTVLMQSKMLDDYATSRRMVKFRTYHGEIVPCVIQELEVTNDPAIANVLSVRVELKEYVGNVVYTSAEIAAGKDQMDAAASELSNVLKGVLAGTMLVLGQAQGFL